MGKPKKVYLYTEYSKMGRRIASFRALGRVLIAIPVVILFLPLVLFTSMGRKETNERILFGMLASTIWILLLISMIILKAIS